MDHLQEVKKRKAQDGKKEVPAKKKAKAEVEDPQKKVEEEKERLLKIRDEEKEKNGRTLFVGNLAVSTIQKDEYKELKKAFSEYGKIESIRFRSVVRFISLTVWDIRVPWTSWTCWLTHFF
jgi:nucleolar protein 12